MHPLPQAQPKTMIRASTNFGASDQDIQFSQRLPMSVAMASGCLAASRALQPGGQLFDLGLGQPVRIDVDTQISGTVARALGLVAYSDAAVDTLFFVYERRDGSLAAVMGCADDILHAIEGWLDYARYFAASWDPVSRDCSDVFAVPDFATLWCETDGILAGADIEGSVVTVFRECDSDYARVPTPVLIRTDVLAEMCLERAKKQGAVNGR
jgi:hypothetical protein